MVVGTYDGAEVYQIVGLFILDKVTTEFDINNIGYNRDEVLSILK